MREITKKKFERFLCILKDDDIVTSWEILELEDTYEYVYSLNTYMRCLKILIYTSIDRNTDKTRPYGSDRIRIVYKWTTKNGIIYAKIKHINRVGKIFYRLESTISNAMEFEPKRYNWTSNRVETTS